MNALGVILAIVAPLGLILFIGDRLFQQALTKEGLCPVCSGAGGPCKYCNGLGLITADKDKKEQRH